MRISDWSSDVCSSDLRARRRAADRGERLIPRQAARPRHLRQTDEVARILRRIAHLVRVVIVEHPDRHVDSRRLHPSGVRLGRAERSEEHTSELQSLMRISYAVFCLKKKKKEKQQTQ